MSDVVVIYVTTGSRAAAERIGHALVEERLAACANIIPGMTSIYRWHGKMEQGDEVVLLLKSTKARQDAAVARIKALHSYDVPCITVWPFSGGHGPFLDWVAAETA